MLDDFCLDFPSSIPKPGMSSCQLFCIHFFNGTQHPLDVQIWSFLKNYLIVQFPIFPPFPSPPLPTPPAMNTCLCVPPVSLPQLHQFSDVGSPLPFLHVFSLFELL